MAITAADRPGTGTAPIAAIGELEHGLMAMWPALETVTDRGWVWRYANGHTGRANSLNCLDPADGAGAEARLQVHMARYRARGFAPTVRVTPLTAPELGALVATEAWQTRDDTRVMVRALSDWPAQPDLGRNLVEGAATDPGLSARLSDLRGLSAEDANSFARMMQKAPPVARIFLCVDEGGAALAGCLALAVPAGGGLFALVTRPDQRRKGLGRGVMARALDWLASEGAASVALQVVAANKAARTLYAGLGFSDAYSYHYRVLQEAGR